ncbi:MAG: nuclear transport factor 2 family protein, partial [Paracoccaceae bacterium]|nr:nuclear transport factor 2 family protein [Paracoccaceae bacterium]
MTPADHAEVVALMETYFEGLHRADSAMLRRVFHPRLAYVCATEGDELYLDLDTYMAR